MVYFIYWAGQKVHLVLSKNKRHIFHLHQELYRTTYSLTKQTFWPTHSPMAIDKCIELSIHHHSHNTEHFPYSRIPSCCPSIIFMGVFLALYQFNLVVSPNSRYFGCARK